MTAAPARAAAFVVLRRVFEEGAFADRALHSAAAELSARDRALAMALVYGTVQRRRTLDHILTRLVSRPLERLEPPVLAALRLGAFQLLLLDGIRDHAAVNESVELAKGSSRGGAQLVNAVLRRTTREGPQLFAALDDDTAAHAAVKHSVPDWLAELWWGELGADAARALLEAINSPAESVLRVNTLKGDVASVIGALPGSAAPRPAPAWERHPELPELPEGLLLGGPFDTYGSPLWREGRLMPGSRASMVVARVLDPQPGDRVLDLCAAPGGKTTHLAALMGGQGEITAVELHAGRARALRETCAQMGAMNVRIQHADGCTLIDAPPYDRVLVDPPCSGLGTLQSRPDLRWRPRRGALDELALRQAELMQAGARMLKSGGTLVYSVCTITRAEGDGVIDAFIATHPDFSCEQRCQLLPSRDGTDGFFIARLRRR
ncbi:MAG: 16S rRNA (cytosine(967)-C(5))-methyltransferase RsmB [Solirubrobacteraceae bacterium]